MKSYYTILAASLLFVLAGCAPQIPFTQTVRHEYKLTVEELESLQFYTSRQIILERNRQNIKEKATENGTLAIKNGASVDRVIIPEGTPCVVSKVIDGNRLALQFGESPTEYLVFGSLQKGDHYYTLQTLTDAQGHPIVTYKNETYRLRAIAPADVFLLFQMKGVREFRQKQEVVGGRRL